MDFLFSQVQNAFYFIFHLFPHFFFCILIATKCHLLPHRISTTARSLSCVCPFDSPCKEQQTFLFTCLMHDITSLLKWLPNAYQIKAAHSQTDIFPFHLNTDILLQPGLFIPLYNIYFNFITKIILPSFPNIYLPPRPSSSAPSSNKDFFQLSFSPLL